MKDFDLYEFSALLVPGAVLLAGSSLLYPSIVPMLEAKERSVGELGFFVILSFVAGHLVQAFSNPLVPLFERITGGRPSLTIPQNRCKFLSAVQTDKVKAELPSKLGLPATLDISTLSPKAWSGIVAQMYVAVEGGGRAKRVDVFAANYGLFRGLATALLLLLGLTLWNHGLRSPQVLIVLLASLVVVCARLRRFSELYARELFLEFLQLPSPSTPTT